MNTKELDITLDSILSTVENYLQTPRLCEVPFDEKRAGFLPQCENCKYRFMCGTSR